MLVRRRGPRGGRTRARRAPVDATPATLARHASRSCDTPDDADAPTALIDPAPSPPARFRDWRRCNATWRRVRAVEFSGGTSLERCRAVAQLSHSLPRRARIRRVPRAPIGPSANGGDGVQAAAQLRAGGCQGAPQPRALRGFGSRGIAPHPLARVPHQATADRGRVPAGRAAEHVGPAHGLGAPGADAAHLGAPAGPGVRRAEPRRGRQVGLRLRRCGGSGGRGESQRGGGVGEGDCRAGRRGGARGVAGGIRARVRGGGRDARARRRASSWNCAPKPWSNSRRPNGGPRTSATCSSGCRR